MIKTIFVLFFLSFSFCALASNKDNESPAGFLWYNMKQAAKKPHKIEKRGIPFNSLSFTDRDAVLRFYTMEALHKARHTKSVEDMKAFLSLQDYWLKESSRFSEVFQKTMLTYPEYDYTVTHPTSNLGAKMMDEIREKNRKNVIGSLSNSHGLLFFYRGSNPYDQKQIAIVRDFCKRFNLPLIPVSVDGTLSNEFVRSRIDHGQANQLGVRYFPALMLVNPHTKNTMPVAYGLTTQDALELRLYQVATQFKGESA
ncbi:type-F conjugative transfer system pilin assembly protein TraF [Legionella pneumophila]|uniref:type-F conjugative transfer system pilin assembly protein TraF n=1 Tax=Legionella pneumophila TaxID=446 RepID=UPI00077816A9|nr:type-F conjugative transfer system pilin assembly protein TraF [Legionella pneumophila]HAT8643611.1 type-F conjugative transfer system pilin assembly protein TraF [Legionella pneumophila]